MLELGSTRPTSFCDRNLNLRKSSLIDVVESDLVSDFKEQSNWLLNRTDFVRLCVLLKVPFDLHRRRNDMCNSYFCHVGLSCIPIIDSVDAD